MEPSELMRTWISTLARATSLQSRPVMRANLAGAVSSSLALFVLLHAWQSTGEPTPPSLNNSRFSVAMMVGPKQAAQEAPENAEAKAPDVAVAPKEKLAEVVTAERDTSLPKAVAAAQTSSVGPEATKEDEVIPPAQVSMPGGRLVAQDASIGEQPDPFAMGPRQVYIRIYVDADGVAKRGGIVRQGAEPMRDSLILKAMMSRKYTTAKLLRVPGGEPLWQLDLVIEYGTNEFLP